MIITGIRPDFGKKYARRSNKAIKRPKIEGEHPSLKVVYSKCRKCGGKIELVLQLNYPLTKVVGWKCYDCGYGKKVKLPLNKTEKIKVGEQLLLKIN